MARLFGSREVVLGAATLLARGKTRRNLILAGVGVDAADTAAAVLAGESGSVDRTTQVLLAVAAATAVLAGLAGCAPAPDQRAKLLRTGHADGVRRHYRESPSSHRSTP